MKFVTMNPWAATFGGRLGKGGEVLADLPELRRIEVAGLDERDQPGRDGGEHEGREHDREQEEAVAHDLAPFLGEDGRHVTTPHQATASSSSDSPIASWPTM